MGWERRAERKPLRTKMAAIKPAERYTSWLPSDPIHSFIHSNPPGRTAAAAERKTATLGCRLKAWKKEANRLGQIPFLLFKNVFHYFIRICALNIYLIIPISLLNNNYYLFS